MSEELIVVIVKRYIPKHGKHIPEQNCPYFKTIEGLPAIKIKWEGLFFGGKEETFVFARDTVKVATVSDKRAKFEARASRFIKAGPYGFMVGGIIGDLLVSAVSAATAKTAGVKGFEVTYANEKQCESSFIAVASPEMVDEIFRSLPPEKIGEEKH